MELHFEVEGEGIKPLMKYFPFFFFKNKKRTAPWLPLTAGSARAVVLRGSGRKWGGRSPRNDEFLERLCPKDGKTPGESSDTGAGSLFFRRCLALAGVRGRLRFAGLLMSMEIR